METLLYNAKEITSILPVEDSSQEYLYLRGRVKKRRQLKKHYREQGMSRQDAGKAARSTLKSGIGNIMPTGETINDATASDNGDYAEEDLGPLGYQVAPGADGEETEESSVNWLMVGLIGATIIGIAVTVVLTMPSKKPMT